MKLTNPRTGQPSPSYMTNGAKPKLDDATIAEIKRKSEAGASNTELAEEYGVKADTIRRAIVRASFGGAK